MKLYEYQAKELFHFWHIPVPSGWVCADEEQVRRACARLGREKEIVLKSQVRAGGRGKAGGIRICSTTDEAVAALTELQNMKIKGLQVAKVLVEEKVEIKNEYYVGITIDPTAYKPVLLLSSRGGIEVETIAAECPEALYHRIINPSYGIPAGHVIQAVEALGIPRGCLRPIIDIVKQLFRIFLEYDSTLVEINPLVETDKHGLVAVDARLNVDDNALYKHEDLKKYAAGNEEMSLRDRGVYFVPMGGDVGLICVGAGMTMATMDLVDLKGGKPACFCDISAGINAESMALALKTVTHIKGVKVILINMFGGLTRMDEVATSFVQAWQATGGIPQPIVIRLEGTNVDEGRRIIQEHGFNSVVDLYDAVEKAVELARS